MKQHTNKSAYRPPADAAPAAPAVPARNPNVYIPDPWLDRSEEFYGSIYAGGKCKFCGCPIPTWKDLCDCAAMKAAREEFKRKIRIAAGYTAADSAPIPAAPAGDYDPNKHIEPAERREFPL